MAIKVCLGWSVIESNSTFNEDYLNIYTEKNQLHRYVKRYFAMVIIRIKIPQTKVMESRKMEKTIFQLPNGKYEIGLL